MWERDNKNSSSHICDSVPKENTHSSPKTIPRMKQRIMAHHNPALSFSLFLFSYTLSLSVVQKAEWHVQRRGNSTDFFPFSPSLSSFEKIALFFFFYFLWKHSSLSGQDSASVIWALGLKVCVRGQRSKLPQISKCWAERGQGWDFPFASFHSFLPPASCNIFVSNVCSISHYFFSSLVCFSW